MKIGKGFRYGPPKKSVMVCTFHPRVSGISYVCGAVLARRQQC